MKKIRIFDSRSEMNSWAAAHPSAALDPVDLRQYENVIIRGQYSADDEYLKEAVFQVEILSSKTKMDLTNPIFRSVPAKYSVQEIYYPETGTYSYIIDQQMSLMAAYPAYSEMLCAGVPGCHGEALRASGCC